MPRLALLRHGHTDWNRAGRIQGRSDISLDDEARETLMQYQLPDDWQSAALCSSPLARAIETARIVAGRDPVPVAALTEMDWGEWEGRRNADLLAEPESGFRHIEDWGWAYHAPGGESPAQLRDRLAPWLSGLKTDTLAVCHIGVMRVLLAQAWGWEFSGPAPFRVKRNRLYILSLPDLTPEPEPIRLAARKDHP
ncbi:MAG: histidine phosphatase family protein [Paracoccaceae bacterium]